MAANEPYSKTEVDAKLETVETRLDNTLNKMMCTIEKGFLTIEKRFEAVDQRFEHTDKRIDDLWKITLGIGVALFVAIAGIYIQNATQRPEKPLAPVTINNQIPGK